MGREWLDPIPRRVPGASRTTSACSLRRYEPDQVRRVAGPCSRSSRPLSPSHRAPPLLHTLARPRRAIAAALRPQPRSAGARDRRAAREETHELVHDGRGGERREVGVVVGRGDLDDVGRHQTQSRETAEDHQQLPRRQPTDLRRPRPGGVGRDRASRCRSRCRAGGPRPARGSSGRPLRPLRGGRPPCGSSGSRSSRRRPCPASCTAVPGCHMHRGVIEEQSLLRRAPQERAVRVGSAEVRVPRVEVRVEMHQRDGAVRRGASSGGSAAGPCGHPRC